MHNKTTMQAKIIVGTLRRDYGSLADWSSARRRQYPMPTAMVVVQAPPSAMPMR
jgi:hypothetical protein